MILVDDRVGSKELFRLFPKGSAELSHLEFGDFAFMGHGEDGCISIGIERKRTSDFINSMTSGRLSGHQLIGLMNSYHYIYLIIEGIFRASPESGILEVWRRGGWQEYTAGKRRFMARDILLFMTTLQVICGLHCYHCSRPADTVHYIQVLHHWWHKEYGEHRGHLQPHTGAVVDLSKQSLVRRVAAQLDGIGWGKAKAIDQRFGTVAGLVGALPSELAEIEGIGKTLTASIIKQLHGAGT